MTWDINLAIAGGLLIGASAVFLLWFNGRIAGVCGIANGIMDKEAKDKGWRIFFLFGLLMGPVIYLALSSKPMPALPDTSLWLVGASGFMVGAGTRLANGCTSGHGVCGLSRFSIRSLVSVVIFMLTGGISVFIVRHGFGG